MFLYRAALSRQQFVGALHTKIPHFVGILNNQRVHHTGLQRIHRNQVGVKSYHPQRIRQLQLFHRLCGAHAGGLVECQQNIDLGVRTQHLQCIFPRTVGLRQRMDRCHHLRTAAFRQCIHRAALSFLPVGTVYIVIDDANLQVARSAVQRSFGGHLPGTVIVGADVGSHLP